MTKATSSTLEDGFIYECYNVMCFHPVDWEIPTDRKRSDRNGKYRTERVVEKHVTEEDPSQEIEVVQTFNEPKNGRKAFDKVKGNGVDDDDDKTCETVASTESNSVCDLSMEEDGLGRIPYVNRTKGSDESEDGKSTSLKSSCFFSDDMKSTSLKSEKTAKISNSSRNLKGGILRTSSSPEKNSDLPDQYDFPDPDIELPDDMSSIDSSVDDRKEPVPPLKDAVLGTVREEGHERNIGTSPETSDILQDLERDAKIPPKTGKKKSLATRLGFKSKSKSKSKGSAVAGDRDKSKDSGVSLVDLDEVDLEEIDLDDVVISKPAEQIPAVRERTIDVVPLSKKQLSGDYLNINMVHKLCQEGGKTDYMQCLTSNIDTKSLKAAREIEQRAKAMLDAKKNTSSALIESGVPTITIPSDRSVISNLTDDKDLVNRFSDAKNI